MAEARFETMMTRYEKLVYTICYQFTQDHHAAQDLSQDTFLAVYTHLAGCPDENPKAWVARIAANKAKDYLKSAYHRKVCSAGGEELPPDGAVLFIREESPEREAIGRETQSRVSDEIFDLREPYTRVAALHFLADYSVAEIAERLGRPRKTVQTQIGRARRQLRQRLEYLAPAAGA